MSDTDFAAQISQLDDRLIHLEALTAPTLLSVAPEGRQNYEGSLLRSLQSVQDKLFRIMDERRMIGDFLHRYMHFKEELQRDHSELELESMQLDSVSKRDILLASEDDLVHHAHQLKAINNLKDELDSAVLQGFEHLIPRLNEIEAKHIQQSNREARLRGRLIRILHSYNQFVNTLSELFIWCEEVLSNLELEALQYEKSLEE